MLPELRGVFNRDFKADNYRSMLARLDDRCGTHVEFRIAETPIFVPVSMLESMAEEGARLTHSLLADSAYLAAARSAIPKGYRVANQTPRPHFLTADFALVQDSAGSLTPKLVEIQAFPSVFAYQAELCSAYREAFGLPGNLGVFLGGLNEASYWALFSRTVLGDRAPENVVLTEIDPLRQKTLPDFLVTARALGIAVVDITSLSQIGNRLHYRNSSGQLVPIHRIYNRAIADELISRKIELPFELSRPWNVEWAGHPDWYFLISKYSLPWLSRSDENLRVVPPAALLSDFLAGRGRDALLHAGVPLPSATSSATIYKELLLKPLFSFAGKGIEFEPIHAQLEAIPYEQRANYLVQQRMRFEPTIETLRGLTQAEIRILYMWPDGGTLTPALSLVRLGRGKMMGVDHNKNQEWVGGSAAFYPRSDA